MANLNQNAQGKPLKNITFIAEANVAGGLLLWRFSSPLLPRGGMILSNGGRSSCARPRSLVPIDYGRTCYSLHAIGDFWTMPRRAGPFDTAMRRRNNPPNKPS
jgi:hypothetical protein